MKHTMRRLVSAILLFALCLLAMLALASCGEGEEEVEFIETPYAGTKLYVCNWGEYISDGSEGSLDVVKLFEETYGIDVEYDYFATNEELYALLSQKAEYDVVIPSDYMIARLAKDNLLKPLDKSKITNYHLIDSKYHGQYYDREDMYSVPYSVGMIGVVYNTTLVDPADVESRSWDLLWNKKEQYANGQLINFNNPRDAFGVALISLGKSVNTTEERDWQEAYEYLREQDCIYLMDEVFNKMENGSAAAAAYYVGDCITMMDVNSDLDFYYPDEGTNIFVDAMCIPSTSKNEGAAHLFIDFMLSPDVATANANYISYASPNTAVLSHPDYAYQPGTKGYEILYELPESYKADASKMQYYYNLDEATLQLMTDLWTKLGIDEEEGGLEYGTIVFLSLISLGFVFIVWHYSKKAYVAFHCKKHPKSN